MTYQEAVDYLNALAPRGWRLGLDRMAEFARRAGLSDNLGNGRSKYIHVAGTNGKGSVTAYVQSMLCESGLRTGGFFSPFVYNLRERVQFCAQLITEEAFARIATDLRPIAESFSEADFGGVTEFEFKTAIGFRYWTECQTDWVALEVGLGGRLDSTNIIEPACSIIVSIGLDHTSILGNTLAEIATEKAGIVKPGRPVVIGSMPEEARETIEAIALERGAPIWRLGREIGVSKEPAGYRVTTPMGEVDGLVPGMPGVAQPHNMALAVAAIQAADAGVTTAGLRVGAAVASIPGRFERRYFEGRLVILDGAHNADASKNLAESLESEYPGLRFALITGMVMGHEPAEFYGPLARAVAVGIACPIDFHRAVSPDALAAAVAQEIELRVAGSVEEAMALAIAANLPILVTGSFYLVGEVGRFMEGETR